MSSSIKVVVVSATGETARSIIQGLLDSPTNFEITGISRPSSVTKPHAVALKQKGVKVVGAELKGPKDELVRILTGADVVISCVHFTVLDDQIHLVDAAKAAGVKRFIPCTYQPVMPAGGVMTLRDQKEKIINYIKKNYVPYTIIDAGWWYQILNFKVPSGRIDYLFAPWMDMRMPGDGNVPIATVDLRNIGHHVAKIIADPRTLNKYVYIYDEVKTANEMWDVLDEVSGEKAIRSYVSEKEILDTIATSSVAYAKDPSNLEAMLALLLAEYKNSWGIRGDSQPERAKYLGYLISSELYPDVKPCPLRGFVEDAMAGKVSIPHENWADDGFTAPLQRQL